MPAEANLRVVKDPDLDAFFEFQLDPEACRMTDFRARDRDAYLELWGRIQAIGKGTRVLRRG